MSDEMYFNESTDDDFSPRLKIEEFHRKFCKSLPYMYGWRAGYEEMNKTELAKVNLKVIEDSIAEMDTKELNVIQMLHPEDILTAILFSEIAGPQNVLLAYYSSDFDTDLANMATSAARLFGFRIFLNSLSDLRRQIVAAEVNLNFPEAYKFSGVAAERAVISLITTSMNGKLISTDSSLTRFWLGNWHPSRGGNNFAAVDDFYRKFTVTELHDIYELYSAKHPELGHYGVSGSDGVLDRYIRTGKIHDLELKDKIDEIHKTALNAPQGCWLKRSLSPFN